MTDESVRISVEDLRHKAEAIVDTAEAHIKRATHDELVKTVIVSAVAVAVLVSTAYYLGSRRCRS